jgi:hypothetical protein
MGTNTELLRFPLASRLAHLVVADTFRVLREAAILVQHEGTDAVNQTPVIFILDVDAGLLVGQGLRGAPSRPSP